MNSYAKRQITPNHCWGGSNNKESRPPTSGTWQIICTAKNPSRGHCIGCLDKTVLPNPRRPTREEVAEAHGRTVPDLIRPGLGILFSGINPSLYSAAVGYHFARPGNRFWPMLRAGGVTPRLLAPSEGDLLLELGCGITNVVARATTAAAELSGEELIAGGQVLAGKIERFQPRIIAFLGIGAYRAAFGRPRAAIGLQPESFGPTRVWVLPNPSGLNAHYQAADLGRLVGELRSASRAPAPGPTVRSS